MGLQPMRARLVYIRYCLSLIGIGGSSINRNLANSSACWRGDASGGILSCFRTRKDGKKSA